VVRHLLRVGLLIQAPAGRAGGRGRRRANRLRRASVGDVKDAGALGVELFGAAVVAGCGESSARARLAAVWVATENLSLPAA
jgi:hypothetical protein